MDLLVTASGKCAPMLHGNKNISRRRWLALSTTVLGASLLCDEFVRGAEASPVIPLGFSLYGMKNLKLHAALQVCGDIGYDCVELPVMADWPGNPEEFGENARRDFRSALTDNNLRLTALMENLSALAEGAQHQATLDRLQRAAELAHALSPAAPPLIETVLGGSPKQWEEAKGRMVECLRDWAKVAESASIIIALKPHVSGALHTPAAATWLLSEIDSKQLCLAFDFSHFQLQKISLEESLDAMLSQTRFVHVKDANGTSDAFQFLLPGDGKVDYADYFRKLQAGGYRGDVIVEVSGQIHSRPDYDPVAAAKKSFHSLDRARRSAMQR